MLLSLVRGRNLTESDLAPLDQGLILSAKGEHGASVVAVDLDVGHMLRVAAIAACLVIFSARGPIDVHKTVIVASVDQLLRFVHLNGVDVSSISRRWINSINIPPEFD